MPNCYYCNKIAELTCVKCGRDTCKEHLQYGLCPDCQAKRLKLIQRSLSLVIIGSLIAIPIIIISLIFF
ncbi:MAG: hypothetical protein EU539_10390 [Promethearchaeota archaeon]|nr:MAG: hypothetical protein EU539_10390 [Candidatus Lokiarchaeota archaeon]